MTNSPKQWLKPSLSSFGLLCFLAVVAGSSALPRSVWGQEEPVSASASEAAAASVPEVPKLIRFTGTLLDQRGYPITVPVEATFALYPQKGSEETAAVWQEKQRISPNETGVYTVFLGAVRELPAEAFSSVAAQYLGVRVEAEPEQARTLLVSVPYALESGDAQTLGGLPASAFVRAGTNSVAVSPLAPLVPDAAAAVTPNTVTPVTTIGGTINTLPKFTGASTVASSEIFDTGTSVGIGNVPNAGAKLDVNGAVIVRGKVTLSNSGNATASKAYPSYGLDFLSNAYKSSTKAVDAPYFQLQSEPTGNNTSSPSATFNVLFANNGAAPAETGLYFNPNGTIHFASAQAFPGSVTSVGLTAPSADFIVTGSPVKGAGTFNLAWKNSAPTQYNVADTIVKRDSSGYFAASDFLATGNVGVEGSLSATGVSYLRTVNINGLVGIGTISPGAQVNLNANDAANADSLLLGNTSSKGLQLRDNGTGVDLESIGVPLNINYLTAQQTIINPNGGAVIIGDNRAFNNSYPLLVGSVFDAPSNTSYSADFEATVEIAGDLQVSGTKNFRIDHPMDPANKYLVHAAIESSEVLNQYSGNVITDDSGLATVHLPDWFEVENTDFRYQLTVIGGRFAQAVISSEVEQNQFTIRTNAPGVKVSWQVTARRNDEYIKQHPFVTERDKPASERGTYIHPELYGQPESKRTGGPHHPLPANTPSLAPAKTQGKAIAGLHN